MTQNLVEIVTLIADGYQVTGFEEIEVRLALQNAAIPFRVKATFPSGATQALRLRNADQIEVRTQLLPEGQPAQLGAGDLLCMGAVDDYEADIGEGGNKSVTLNGRSNSRDVVDCPPVDHPTGYVENMTLADAANALGAEFGTKWTTDLDNLATIARVQLNPGESMFHVVERHARMEGVVLPGQPDGSIKITRAGTGRHAGQLAENQAPVQRWSIKVDRKSQRSVVVTRAQDPTSTDPADLQREDRYTPADAPARHRPTAVYLEDTRPANKLRTRGEWHHLRGFGSGMVVSPLVSAWRDSAGTLWTPGYLMAISVPSEQIDMDMTLREATLTQRCGANEGTTAQLVFVDPRTMGGAAPAGETEPASMNPGGAVGP